MAKTAAERKRDQRQRDQEAIAKELRKPKPDLSQINVTGLMDALRRCIVEGTPRFARAICDQLVHRAEVSQEKRKARSGSPRPATTDSSDK